MNTITYKELLTLKSNLIFDEYNLYKLSDMLNTINFSIKRFIKNSDIPMFNNQVEGIMILLEGNVQAHMLFENGDFFPIGTIAPGDMFGISNFFSKKNRNINLNFISKEQSKVLFIPENEFLKFLLTEKKALKKFLHLYNTTLQFLLDKISILSFSNNKLRIAYYLLKEINKTKSNIIKINTTKSYISRYLCMSRSSFYRELNTLIRENAISLKKGSIIICREKQLRKIIDPI